MQSTQTFVANCAWNGGHMYAGEASFWGVQEHSEEGAGAGLLWLVGLSCCWVVSQLVLWTLSLWLCCALLLKEQDAEYASCLLHTVGVPTSLTFIVLAVADGLFSPYMLEHTDVLFITPTNKQYVPSVDVSILFWGCTFGAVDGPCIYFHVVWQSPLAISSPCCVPVMYFEQ